jgi:hypothetical protein
MYFSIADINDSIFSIYNLMEEAKANEKGRIIEDYIKKI